ncbi:MAG TPA: hypothetical protein VFM58_25320 [Solirubrobacteraceae bacterium]|nr:hypothetical protein [Solirubrobacteraceae bacterium]
MDDDRTHESETSESDDREALEEIRRLFARYRRIARHGMVTERDEPVQDRDTATLAGR